MKTNSLIVLATIFLLGTADAISGYDYDALAATQRAEGNTSDQLLGTYYLDIMNATPDLRPKITPGEYDSTSYVIPVGPYEVSFETRSPFNVFGVGYQKFNETAGSGKKYHVNEYEQYKLLMENYSSQIDGSFKIWITHFTGLAKYLPVSPSRQSIGLRIPDNYDFVEFMSERSLTIDGQPLYDQTFSGPHDYYMYICEYSLDPSTYITMQLSNGMDWNKDVLLIIETMHITKKRG